MVEIPKNALKRIEREKRREELEKKREQKKKAKESLSKSNARGKRKKVPKSERRSLAQPEPKSNRYSIYSFLDCFLLLHRPSSSETNSVSKSWDTPTLTRTDESTITYDRSHPLKSIGSLLVPYWFLINFFNCTLHIHIYIFNGHLFVLFY